MWLKIIILLLLHECNSQLNVFEIDYFGKQISVEEFKKLDICYSSICVRDAKKIIAKASHRNDSDPCVDIEEFACGHFNAYKPPNERYFAVGFIYDFELQINDFMRRVLREKIEEDEPKIIKVVKKYYQKCVNSTYIRTEGKATFKSLLYEFGKFPIFEENWNPSDFNITKAIILGHDYLLEIPIYNNIINIGFAEKKNVKNETIRNVLRFDFYVSEELSSEILNDYFELSNTGLDFHSEFVPIHNLDKYLNITSGLDWLEIIKHEANNKDITNDIRVRLLGDHNDFKMFDLKNRRKFANYFTMRYLFFSKLNYFAVYPVPDYEIRSKNRYEICIEDMRNYVNFPLEIMFQLEYGNETVSKAFKEFTEKFLTIESSLKWKQDDGDDDDMNDFVPNPTFIVGFPDELTSPEFLNKLYANLTLTGDEGFYEMSLKLKEYNNVINQEGNNLIALENLSENAKEIFKNCGNEKYAYQRDDICVGLNNSLVFKVQNTLYPLFRPQRPYYVNLAYYSMFSGFIDLIEIDVQKHYSKYVEEFGPEQNLPGFLMTNEQMLEMIKYQSMCSKLQDGLFGSSHQISKSIFNCPIDKE